MCFPEGWNDIFFNKFYTIPTLFQLKMEKRKLTNFLFFFEANITPMGLMVSNIDTSHFGVKVFLQKSQKSIPNIPNDTPGRIIWGVYVCFAVKSLKPLMRW